MAAQWWWLAEWLNGNSFYRDVRNIDCYWDYYSDSHEVLIINIRSRTIRAYIVVVILNVASWLSGVFCYHGYNLFVQGRLLRGEGLWRHSREEEGGSTFFSKLQNAALNSIIHFIVLCTTIFLKALHINSLVCIIKDLRKLPFIILNIACSLIMTWALQKTQRQLNQDVISSRSNIITGFMNSLRCFQLKCENCNTPISYLSQIITYTLYRF